MEAFRKILGRDTAPDVEILNEGPQIVSEPWLDTRGPVEPSARRASGVKVDPKRPLYIARVRNSSSKVHLVKPRQGEAPPERTRSPVEISNPRREAPLARLQLDESSSQRELSDSDEAPPLRVQSDSDEALPERIQPGPKMIKSRHKVVSEEVRPQSKPAQEELPDFIDKFKVRGKGIEMLGQSLEILYNRRILEKEEFQRMVVNLESDNVQMLDAIAELHQLRERTDFENVDLQRLTVNLRRESNEVAITMAKLQIDNKRLSLENDKLRHSADNFRRDNVDVRIAMTRLREECDRLELENRNLRKQADHWRYELDNESSRNALKEQKNREEMEEKYIRQRIEHEELKSTIKEKEEEISRKDSIYQELLQKNKAQKKVRMS